MNDVIVFINKMKAVFNLLPDEEIDTYNDIYNESTEEFITWINKKYEEYSHIIDKLNEVPN
jgi:succinate dehydrogenase flavin-adding protein (antitoxin of CptAB toxin-antitoxin module)